LHSFTEILKNLIRYRSENNFGHQNNYVEVLSIDNNAAKVLTFQFERPT